MVLLRVPYQTKWWFFFRTLAGPGIRTQHNTLTRKIDHSNHPIIMKMDTLPKTTSFHALEENIPTIHFQVQTCWIRFREGNEQRKYRTLPTFHIMIVSLQFHHDFSAFQKTTSLSPFSETHLLSGYLVETGHKICIKDVTWGKFMFHWWVHVWIDRNGHGKSGWWLSFNQPVWKNMLIVKLDHETPQIGVNKKHLKPPTSLYLADVYVCFSKKHLLMIQKNAVEWFSPNIETPENYYIPWTLIGSLNHSFPFKIRPWRYSNGFA